MIVCRDAPERECTGTGCARLRFPAPARHMASDRHPASELECTARSQALLAREATRRIGGPRRVRIFLFHHFLPAVIQLSVNGETRAVEPGASVAQLLERLELVGRRIAVERNGEIVPRSRFADTRLLEGDQLEIVVAVGGG